MEEDGDKKVYHTPHLKQVIVCINHRVSPSQPSCGGRGGGEVLAERIEQEIAAKGWDIGVKRFHCLGRCHQGPVLKLAPGGQFICEVVPEKLEEALLEIERFSTPVE
ncbi:(2Fe-2S) ferredoxin [Mariprofundus aestuarium]|uniref:(2Fe-2S) ferredoxin n=1 Tax=Mariprofundus aestuarium TaxID=1921086 RepID=A0A2K8KZI0_MARES|nr:(2Fe-2S) ferredoxin domain-containing protein [Mariprofundus aestuarium]ATX79319.1 (2Fe-2S) ferredoxin [Mariprofundus aestuarium]